MYRTDLPFRPAQRSLAMICCLIVAMAVHCASAGDPVATFLERHGLTDVLARHLEDRIEQADDSEREALLLHLAAIYTSLLEEESDPLRRAALEQRSRRLLELAPDDTAAELQLALIRNTYHSAERAAEDHRLRLIDADDVDKAHEQFAEIVPELRQLSEQLTRSVSLLERRMSRAGRAAAAALEDRLTQQRRTLMQSRYMHAWSLYYQAYLSDDESASGEHARQAQRIFAELLMTETAHPSPEEVSIDLRSIEPLARSIVGMALCQSLSRQSEATALQWIDLIEHSNTAPEVRRFAGGWRVLILLDHGRYDQAQRELAAAIERDEEVPVSWLRLAAISAMESRGSPPEADVLARFALTQLASRDELQQVLDLAERYGTAALGEDGFAMRYIEGLISYRRARDKHAGGDPTKDQSLRELYRSAQTSFEQALKESDAADYPDTIDSVHMLIAWSMYYADDLRGAAERFQFVAEKKDGESSEQALWMAIVALDRALERTDDAELRDRHEKLAERFLSAYPGSSHAPALLVNRLLHADDLSETELERLLSIPPNHEAYGAARRRALLKLYRDFRRADARNRSSRAYRFLSVAVPMLDQPRTFGRADDTQRIDRQVIAIRQTLEVALHTDVARAQDARTALAAYESLDDEHEEVRRHADELRFRQAQLALLDGDRAEAERIADALWEQDHRSRWAKLAARAIFQHAQRLWHAATEGSDEYQAAMKLVIRAGGRVLREFEDDDEPLGTPAASGVARAVAEASTALWKQTGDQEHGRIALFLTRHLLERHPNHRGLLRNFAMLAGEFDQPEQSLDAWRRLVAGSERGSDSWFEARFHQLYLLADLDPPRAARLMRQHRQLYPNLAPEPWGERMRALAEQLELAQNGEASGGE